MDMHMLLVGDQTYDFTHSFKDLLQDDSDALSRDFLLKAFHRIRLETSHLQQDDRQRIPRFSTWADLLTQRSKGELFPALDQALACAYQLAAFIRNCASQGGIYPQANDTYLVGLCTGALASSAIASARSLTELVPIAVETVVVAFHTGLCAAHVGARVEPSPSSYTSWSHVFAGLTHNAAVSALQSFSDEKEIPKASRPYVSASSDQNVTITAPPSMHRKLREDARFSELRSCPMPIFAPYHAPHLFTKDDVIRILECVSHSAWATQPTHVPTFSANSGNLIWAGNFRSLLEASLTDILLQPLRWDSVSARVSATTKTLDDKNIKIITISTNLGRSLSRTIKASTQASIETIDVSTNSAGLARPADERAGDPSRSKIAIVGMSGRFPGAEDPNAFWNLLHEGLDVHKVVPARSWDVETHVDPTLKRKNTAATPYGCWLEHPELFDNKFFNISPREAPQIDPAQRMALMTAYEAMEQAGIVPDGSPSTQKDRVGIFYGCTSQDWMETNSAQKIDTYLIPGGNRAFIPGRINYSFKFSGPSLSIDTACSSSLAAINVACLSLWRGDTDAAIAGGTNVLTNPDFTAGLDRGHFLSRTGNCKTFDDTADGYCRGEGVCTVILKRLEDALAENDPIQGIILGAYTNHSAEAESITRPHVGAQRDIFKKILDYRSIDPYDVGYVEMHGTGTQAGDASEMSSVLDTFAPAGARPRTDEQRLFLGSAKANIGHGESVSGATSLAKVLLMMKHSVIPPHVGIKTKINHRFPTDLENRNVHIARKPTAWPRPEGGVRRVFLNNFSAAGGNTALLLEDAPRPAEVSGSDPRSTHVVVASARCAASVKGNVASLIDWLSEAKEDVNSLAQLSYTTTARRIHHAHRVVACGSTFAEIKAKLAEALEQGQGSTRAKAPPKVLFAFTGQGSQYPGMGKQLYDTVAGIRDDIDGFNQIALQQGFPSFKPVLLAEKGDIADHTPVVVQLANVCLEMAIFRYWKTLGVAAAAVVGHSLGEYAALNAAGVISEADAIFLVGRRAQLLQELCSRNTHSMLAVKASADEITTAVKEPNYEVACLNSPNDVVLSGTTKDIANVSAALTAKKRRSTLLKVPYAFHSSQVDPVLPDFEATAQSVSFKKPTIPILCPLTGEVIETEGVIDADYLARHCREPVNMLSAIETAKSQGILNEAQVVIEAGPQPVVSGMVKAILGAKVKALSTLQRNKDSWALLADTASTLYSLGIDINWRQYHRDFDASHRVVSLPAYHWDSKPFWMQYVHDWSLRKGDAPLVAPAAPKEEVKAVAVAPKDPTKHALESTTIHRVVEETITNDGGKLIVEADISRADLHPFVQGHKVNEVPLCTPSVYADMAWSMGTYLLEHHRPSISEKLVDVSEMVLERALVAQPKGPQLIRASGTIQWATKSVVVEFLTVDTDGTTLAKHSQCTIRFLDPKTIKATQEASKPKLGRIDELYGGLASCKTFRFSKKMAYRAVSSLAQFDDNYQAMNEVVLDNEEMEAATKVDLKDIKKGGIFNLHPAYVDSLSQSGGFVMNCNDKANLDVDIFVNHGWHSFQLYEKLDVNKVYRTHVQMHPTVDKMWEGDVNIFQGDRLIAKFGGVILQGVPRRLMNMILKQEMGSKAPGAKAKGKTVPQAAPQPAKQPAKKPALQPAAQVTEAAPAPVPVEAAPVTPQAEAKVMGIIVEESGLALEDLTDTSGFADLGIDSLLGMIITGRMKEELDIEIESTAFLEFSSIGDLKKWIASNCGGGAAPVHAADPTPVKAPAPPVPAPIVAAPTVPEAVPVAATPAPAPAPEIPTISNASSPKTSEAFGAILRIISEESGIAEEELTDDTSLADAGVDSLLSMLVVGRCQEELNIDLDAHDVFSRAETIKGLKILLQPFIGPTAGDEAIENSDGSGSGSSSDDEKSDGRTLTPDTEQSEAESEDFEPKSKKAVRGSRPPTSEKIRQTTSVLLQGKPKTSTKMLFLFPDGSGSAASYTHLSNIGPEWTIFGLNCPYVRHPEDMSCNLDQLITSYLDEIRRRQPTGPYHFGGWSAGGILAYRATEELMRIGEKVEHLLLIDSPVPKGLDKLPQRFMDHCDDIGVWSHAMPGRSSSPSKFLVPHFNAVMDVLGDYFADPLPADYVPKTSLIWAAETVMDGDKAMTPADDDVEDMKFLSEKRTDFTAGEWARLLPGTTVKVAAADGATHFSMLQGEHGVRLSQWIKAALE